MKKYLIVIFIVASALGVKAQSNKHFANFSLFQQYYNPALTGYEGAVLKTLYRNQWTGFENAPKTIFASGEVDLASLKSWQQNKVFRRQMHNSGGVFGASHAMGLAILRDQFGPVSETQFLLSYASRLQLSSDISLRWGTALTYNMHYLDGNMLTPDQENDPEFQNLTGQGNRVHKADLNLGILLSSNNWYFGYAVNDVSQGKLFTTGDDFMKDAFTMQHVVQTGSRFSVTEKLGLVGNAIIRYDSKQKETIEAQVKGVYANMIWLGGGLRKDLAYSATAGVHFDQFSIAYVYEVGYANARYVNMATNEISLSYNLIKEKQPKHSRQVVIW